VLTEEGLALIEANAETILSEYGIEFREDPEALAIWRGGRCRRAGLAREVPTRHVPRTRAEARAAGVRAVRAQPRSQRAASAATRRSSRRRKVRRSS
jgi:trimethylamine--corrinoid protein Co-methyltransferase